MAISTIMNDCPAEKSAPRVDRRSKGRPELTSTSSSEVSRMASTILLCNASRRSLATIVPSRRSGCGRAVATVPGFQVSFTSAAGV